MARTERETLILAGGARLPAGASDGYLLQGDGDGSLIWVPISVIVAEIPADGPASEPTLRSLGVTGNKAMPGVTTLDEIPAAVAPVALNGQRLTALGDATGATDALNRESGDGRYAQRANDGSDFSDTGTTRYNLGVGILGACVAAATANVSSLSGPQTIDSVAAAAGDFVLLTAQSSSSQNGPWQVQAGAWTRPASFPSGGMVMRGRIVFVAGGTSNAGIWSLAASTTGLVIDTNAQSWANQRVGGTGPQGIQGVPGTAGPAGPSGGYGDGSDGAVTLNGTVTPTWAVKAGSTYTLQRDVYATTLTVNSGVTLIPGGFRVFATVSLTNNGTIHNDGGAASGPSAGLGGLWGFFGGGGAGGQGSGPGSPSVGQPGASNGAASADGSVMVGGSGGASSSGLSGYTPTGRDANPFYGLIPRNAAPLLSPFIAYCGGGGGGASVAGSARGGGGGGGGLVVLFARSLVNGGAIHARGGAGASGGGGGGGGFVALIYDSLSGAGTVDANGGAAGTGAVAGSNGTVVNILNV